ncbi:MAG: NAD(P)-binding protein [Methylococcales symbiont of Hymedesmia sp. n. MRB-2018]|nr:MAG: NAD(P)-binding protein [Methylococcales symbiont of Hymedesmia sp. n. MRB-2018]KAF3984669.1 MAG: NAD(P)-binding protein [Methylococcales symbiont of Hymedesmia sp. n. MRB-2018]
MKIGIIGSGVSAMSVARMLNHKHQVTLFEQENHIGGIASTKNLDGVAYHLVGGHCFNSKNQAVLDFVFNNILAKDQWHLVQRDAKIAFKNHTISYPIEFAVQEIAQFDEQLAVNIIEDFISADNQSCDNLAQWFVEKFGKTLAEEYLIPYNQKIWHQDPKKMSPSWVEGKLPTPNKKDFIKNLLHPQQDTMPHAYFYYPNSNDQNTFLTALSAGLDVNLETKITSIVKQGNQWLLNNEYTFDHIISTMPLNKLPFVIQGTPSAIKAQAEKLKYNQVSNMLWESRDLGGRTWTYYPDKDTIFHRHIHIGNFFIPKKNFTITESIGSKSYDEMLEAGQKIDYLSKPVDYHQSDYAYVVYDNNHQSATTDIKDYLTSIGLDTLGRFGQWEYFNMDICIENAMRIAEKLVTTQRTP